MSERNPEASNASLYSSLLYIDDSENILGRHCKLIPTAGERTIWSQGDIIGPVKEKEEIIYTEDDLKQILASKRMFDVAGHYHRPDVFDFKVNR